MVKKSPLKRNAARAFSARGLSERYLTLSGTSGDVSESVKKLA